MRFWKKESPIFQNIPGFPDQDNVLFNIFWTGGGKERENDLVNLY